MRLVLGIDGGGTKTDCVLMDEGGSIRGRSRSGPSNPHRIGFGAALAAIKEAARLAMAEGQVAPQSVTAVCAGLGGVAQADASEKMRVLLAAEFPSAVIRVCTDQELTLRAARSGPCIVLEAGTGSFAIGRNAEGEVVRIGGHGPMISDEGSAYDVGRRAVMAALREHDRTGSESALGKRILREMGCAQWTEIRTRVEAASDEVFPRLFSAVATLADNGDETAQGILRAAAFELASLAAMLAQRLHLSEHPFPLVETGGMIGRSKFFDAQLHKRLRAALPSGEISALEISPAEAAGRMALELIPVAEAEGH
jgi:N-acetylglucosamine kinase-like BadF-type ATPase